MSVRVNLLPQATREQVRSARRRTGIMVAGLVLLAALGAFHLWGERQLGAERAQLAAQEQATTALRGEVAELAEYQGLEQQRDQSVLWLQSVFASEYSMADVLQDVATVVPDDTQIDNLTITTLQSDGTVPSVTTSLAEFNATGQTVASHAPGVERLLLEFGRVAAFRDLAFSSASANEDGDATTYTVAGRIGPIARTGRYDTGLPEALR